MKKLSMLFVIFAAFFMFVACDNNLKFTPEGGNIDSGDTSDHSDTSDTSDTSDPTTEQPDSGDSQSDDDTDTAAEDDSDTIPDDDSDTDTGTTPTETALNCVEIYECMADCNNNDTCPQECLNNGTAEGLEVFTTMHNCWTQNCANEQTNEGFTNCVVANCKAETEACGLIVDDGNQADTSYNSPYGSLSLNFSVDQVGNDYYDQTGIVSSAFATGTYGNGSTSVTPADAYMMRSSASYYQENSYSAVQVQQIPVYSNNGQDAAGGNPVVILEIPKKNAYVGTLKTSLYSGSQAMLYVVDVNWDSNAISCVHAFGEGYITITNIGDFTDHGPLAFNGNVTLYSPKNYEGNGDISGQLGIQACDPVQ